MLALGSPGYMLPRPSQWNMIGALVLALGCLGYLLPWPSQWNMIAALVLILECRGGLLLRLSQEPLSRLRDLKSSRDEQRMGIKKDLRNSLKASGWSGSQGPVIDLGSVNCRVIAGTSSYRMHHHPVLFTLPPSLLHHDRNVYVHPGSHSSPRS